MIIMESVWEDILQETWHQYMERQRMTECVSVGISKENI
jgi:hypothetical protein